MERAFELAYQTDASWAVANLTTWYVFLTAANVLASIAVVATAFLVQRRQFRQDRKRANTIAADFNVAALGAESVALQTYDAVTNGVGLTDDGFSVSDTKGRLQVSKRLIEHYLGQGATNSSLVYALVTVLTLLDRVIADIDSIPGEGDRRPLNYLEELKIHRQRLRDGAGKILELAFKQPTGEIDLPVVS